MAEADVHPMMKPHEDGTLPTFMDVASRVHVLLTVCGDDGKWSFPGTDICPHDDSYRAWLSSESHKFSHDHFFKQSLFEEEPKADRPTVLDVARLWLLRERMQSTHEPPPWKAPDSDLEESLVEFAAELGVPPERVDRKVYTMLCELRSVEDVVRSPLLLRGSKTKLLQSYANARQTGKVRVFSTQGLNYPLVMADEEEVCTPWAQMRITSGPWRGHTIAEAGLCSIATRDVWYNFHVAPSGTCSFSGTSVQNVPARVSDELRAIAEQVNAQLVSRKETAEADRAGKLAAEHARQTARNESESEKRRAIRTSARHAKMTKEEASYTPSGPSHKTPKSRYTCRVDDITRAKRATEAEKGRNAAAAHEGELRDKEAKRVQELEEQREYRRIAAAIQQGD